ncbi:Chromosome transmission fidelity protein 18 [Coemansia sp. RSA 2049]|nr:Chromosome transmission fidelity protein 18 [Coemansia sp. RSA 2049]
MPPSQEQPDLRQALLGSSLGAPVFAAGLAQQDTEDTSSAATAKGVLDRLGRSSASAHAQATEFPDTYDELEKELDEMEELPAGGLTLLPTAEFSDTDDCDGEEEEDGGRGSQFAQFADARVVSDIHTGQVVLQRREEEEEALLSESDRRDAERQGVEVAGILGGMTIRKEMEENARLAAQSIAVFSPAERYAAYRTAMERTKGQQMHGEDETAEEEEIRKRQRITDGSTLHGAGSGNVKSKDTPPAAPLLVDILSAKYALPPETGDFVTARTARGRNLYFAVRSDIDAAKRMDRMAAAVVEGSETGRMGAAQTNRVVGVIEAELDTAAAGAAGSETTEPPAQHGTLPPSSSSSSMLWVDKYRARTFVDLVSDERTNRAVMQWLKEWDYCVFGRGGDSGGGGGGADGNTDRWRRPLRRILLLSGPPGLGKTTLAHVAAAQAGYAVVEINASDDRTATRIRDRVVGVTQTHAMRAAARPQLLVIDEIDGVSGAQATQGGDLATMLVRLANAASADRRQRKGDPGPLLRPIVCICNNAYAPALRALRQAAVCYHVHPPTAVRLARRLEEVCAAEGVAADTWGLVEVAKQHGGDMRACLNALQLACASDRGEAGTLEERMRRAGGGGTKDVQRSLFGVWALVFTRPDAAATASAFGAPRRSGDASHARMVVEAVAASGELERVMQGCFENYLRMDFRDLTHTRVAELSGGWLSFHDSVDHACRRSPLTAAALHPYLAYAALAVHRTCCSAVGLARGDFEYPHSEFDAFQRRQTTHAVAQSLVSAGRLRASVDSTVAVVGFADYLLHILSPPQLVSSNKHLLKPPEKAALDRLVQVMAAWRLSFVQTRDVGSGSTDQLVYRLEPPIDRLAAYAGRRPALPVLPMRYPVRQLVAQEMELAVRARAARDADGSAKEGDAAKRDYLAKLFADPLAAASGARPKAGPAVARDFFGRVVVPPATGAHKDGDSMRTGNEGDDSRSAACVPAAPRTWFRFFEGFSNAVRKPTQMRELF